MSGSEPKVAVMFDRLREWGDACEDCSQTFKRQLGPAGDACDDLEGAAKGWEFVGSLPQMRQRWEDLNEHMRGRLDDAAESFRDSADNYEDNENFIEQMFDSFFGW